MPSESVTKRSHCYDVWFAEERIWAARVTWPAQAELYPDEKGPIFGSGKILRFAKKGGLFAENSVFTTVPRQDIPTLHPNYGAA